jgi:hypothetical protein
LAPEADRSTLLRRVTLDLTGLPPSLEEQEAFLNDPSPDAYEKVVDRLLASPQFGERWAQHWLDVVRYAESNGYEADGQRPHFWRYRDYVINSFNADKPYGQFLAEQIAGDELAKGQDPRAAQERLVATAMHLCGPVQVVGGNSDREINRQEVLTEMVNGVGATFLGLTLGCARCHDHKFDPISQADYYRIQAFFAATVSDEVNVATEAETAAHQRASAALQARMAPLRVQIAAIEAPYRARLTEEKKARLEPKYRDALAIPADKRTPEQKELAAHAQILAKVTWDEVVAALPDRDRSKRAALRAQVHALEAELPPPPMRLPAVRENSSIPPTHLLKRGDVKRKGAEILPEFIRVVDRAAATAEPGRRRTRLDLARWLNEPGHPLTARVIVNRLWQHHFGRGIVATPNDFGRHGEPPSHPELLDWLATELSQTNGRLKPFHRLMVLSQTYRQSSRLDANPTAVTADPENRLLGRMNRRRMEAEAIRDSLLAAAGNLLLQGGGPMVRVPLEPEVYDLIFTEDEPDGLWKTTVDARQHGRRSIYLFAKRNVRLPLLEVFDQPDTLTSCAARMSSTFAPQALVMMNGPLAQQQGRLLATRLLRQPGDLNARIAVAFRWTLNRPPTSNEQGAVENFLRQQRERIGDRLLVRESVNLPTDFPDDTDPAEAAAVVDFCLSLLNLHEFSQIP